MLVCWAQSWAAWRIRFSQVEVDPNALLNFDIRLLLCPAMLVPSGMKLMVISCGAGQALPDAE